MAGTEPRKGNLLLRRPRMRLRGAFGGTEISFGTHRARAAFTPCGLCVNFARVDCVPGLSGNRAVSSHGVFVSVGLPSRPRRGAGESEFT
jgi:hypothetical protein